MGRFNRNAFSSTEGDCGSSASTSRKPKSNWQPFAVASLALSRSAATPGGRRWLDNRG